MAVTSSGSGSDNTSFVKISGIVKVKEVLVNPTLKELQDYGVNWLSQEPDYLLNDDNGKGIIITFYYRLDTSGLNSDLMKLLESVVLNHRNYVYNKVRYNNDGTKQQFINAFGQTTWAENEEAIPDTFNKEGMRPALVGEESLITSLKAWGDVRRSDQCSIDTFPAIFKGNFTELKSLEKAWKTHKFKVLTGLKDKGEGKFSQVVYTRAFWRAYATTVRVRKDNIYADVPFIEGIPLLLSQEYNDFKADYYTIPLKIWDMAELKSVTPDDDAVPASPVEEDDVF